MQYLVVVFDCSTLLWYTIDMLRVLPSALKHHISEQEIRYAIAALAEIHPIDDRYGRRAFAIIGPRHLGALREDYIEVLVVRERNGDFTVFHALTATR